MLDADDTPLVLAPDHDGNTREGALALTTGDLARLVGRPTTPLADGLRPHRDEERVVKRSGLTAA